ncbi:PepSY domain-containing protein [Rhizobium sp. AN80A]|uniref:PepSY domain-containing protein n=1 Tax=Rhizobium sp. AN80A TaxID=3040673 RepID=UPI0024B34FC3|nr:PepSY domain-containing protein [Rhizobium sp. AN80A]
MIAHYRKLIVAIGVVAVTAGVATAQTPTNEPAWMAASQLTAKFEAQGYSVREISRDDGHYDVDVTDKNNVRSDMHVDRATGEPLARSAAHNGSNGSHDNNDDDH